LVMELVTVCSDIFECPDIGCKIRDELKPGIINLFKATKLKNAVFRCTGVSSLTSEWLIMILQTITHKHQDLRQILIHTPYSYNYNMDLNLIEQVEAKKPGVRW